MYKTHVDQDSIDNETKVTVKKEVGWDENPLLLLQTIDNNIPVKKDYNSFLMLLARHRKSKELINPPCLPPVPLFRKHLNWTQVS
jgi:hypothetical protein